MASRSLSANFGAACAKARSSATFEYDDAWLKHPARYALQPALALGKGPLHTPAGRQIFGAIGDSAPDRWGRMLIQRNERRKAKEEARARAALVKSTRSCWPSATPRGKALCRLRQKQENLLAEGVQMPPLLSPGRTPQRCLACHGG